MTLQLFKGHMTYCVVRTNPIQDQPSTNLIVSTLVYFHIHFLPFFFSLFNYLLSSFGPNTKTLNPT